MATATAAWAASQTLRTSASASNVGGSSWTGIGGSGTGKERRKGSIASLKQHYNQTQASSASTSLPSPTSPPPHSPVSMETDASGSASGGSQLTVRVGSSIRKARRTSYFDQYPERNTARNRTAATSNKTAIAIAVNGEDAEFGVAEALSASPSSGSGGRKGKEKDKDVDRGLGKVSPSEENFAFPPMRERRNGITQSASKSKLSPSAKSPYLVQDDLPGLRFSYSSSQTTQAETETPPQTPIDAALDTQYSLPQSSSYLHRHPRHYSPNDPYRNSITDTFDPDQVVVAAPISGVEAMDALVDGMDGSDDDDLFKRLQMTTAPLSFSFTERERVPSHHPLYAPPLPTPPPGVKLGGALPRGLKAKSNRSRVRADALFGVDGGHSSQDDDQGDLEQQRREVRRVEDVDLEREDESEGEDSRGEEDARFRVRTGVLIEHGDDGSGLNTGINVTPQQTPTRHQRQQRPRSHANSGFNREDGIEGRPHSVSSSVTDSDTQAMAASTSFAHTSVPAPPPSIDDIVRKHAPPPSSSSRAPPRSSSANAAIASTTNSNYYGLSRTSTVGNKPSRPTTAVPTIDEIIRKNSAALASSSRPQTVSSRPESRATTASGHAHHVGGHGYGTTSSLNGHGFRNGAVSLDISDKESEPEPLSPKEEAELVARSSIDSVAAEVQQTLRAAEALANSHQQQQREAQSRSDFSAYVKSSANNSRSGGSSIHSGTNSHSGGVPPSPYSSPDVDLSFLALQNKSRPGTSTTRSSQKDAIATYLRSSRITTLLKLTRRPHASPEAPLTVSLSDLGSPTGFPLVVFLGLGCVRYVMGLYDEMAECLGLRLITIDRWGIGRTGTPPTNAVRGVPEWSTVVDEVLDRLHIDKCSIMAHSAGAPYALAFANKYPERVVGDICLLAPWVGGGAGGGYRWLRYVPNGLLKTAQAAEWKIQAWMIGKPPKITYEGIGYNVKAPVSSDDFKKDETSFASPRYSRAASEPSSTYGGDDFDERDEVGTASIFSAGTGDGHGRTPYFRAPSKKVASSSSSHTFSDYDDLEDFGGRFESRSTLEPRPRANSGGKSIDSHAASGQNGHSQSNGGRTTKKKTSKGFLRIWKGLPSNQPPPPMPSIDGQLVNAQHQSTSKQQSGSGKKLKSLKSIGSLRNKSSNQSAQRPKTAEKSPVLPEQAFDVTLGLDELKNIKVSTPPSTPPELPRPMRTDSSNARGRGSTCSVDSPPVSSSTSTSGFTGFGNGRSAYGRAGGRRSISLTASTATHPSIPSQPPSSFTGLNGRVSRNNSTSKKSSNGSSESYQVALGNALIAASHAESSKGTHTDLLQILNHEQKPWGFSYARYPHKVRVWYGDRDERIAENAVRWMESNMGSDRCLVKVVKGADHGLMYRTNVVVDVLEQSSNAWLAGEHDRRDYSTYGLSSDPFNA